MKVESRISDEALDVLQEDPIFLVGWPPAIVDAEIKRIRERIKSAPKDQQGYVEVGIKAAQKIIDGQYFILNLLFVILEVRNVHSDF